MQEELEKRTKEVQSHAEERADLEKLKAECEQFKTELEKDRKSLKELQVQNVRLRSLVKIGEDSIKGMFDISYKVVELKLTWNLIFAIAEQTRIEQLQDQLRLRNGATVSTPCLATSNGNGKSPQDLKNSSTENV